MNKIIKRSYCKLISNNSINNSNRVAPKFKFFKDTIFNLSSGIGKSGVSIIRVSGPESKLVLKKLTKKKDEFEPKARLATLSTIYNPITNEQVDKGMFIWFPKPNSFTGEDVVEFHIHGSRAVISETLDAIASIDGTRASEQGEFTRRAFENGKMDLTQIEGLSDLLDASTSYQKKVALKQMQGSIGQFYLTLRKDLIKASAYMEAFIDFGDDAEIDNETVEHSKRSIISIRDKIQNHLDDGRRGERLRDGASISIVGPPNSGKSSLINLLSNRKASIVSPIAGTTRDIVEVTLDIGGFPVNIGDTAGLRLSTNDIIEKEGIEMAKERFNQSDLKLFLFDSNLLLNSVNNNNIDNNSSGSISIYDNEEIDNLLNFIDNETIIIFNKFDLINSNININNSLDKWNQLKFELIERIKSKNGLDNIQSIEISCNENINIKGLLDLLKLNLSNMFEIKDQESPLLTRARYKQNLIECVESLDRYLYYCDEDIVIASEELRRALLAISSITHPVDLNDLLDVIFRDFCIGK